MHLLACVEHPERIRQKQDGVKHQTNRRLTAASDPPTDLSSHRGLTSMSCQKTAANTPKIVACSQRRRVQTAAGRRGGSVRISAADGGQE